MILRSVPATLLLLLSTLAAADARAQQQTVIYRCTDAQGAVVIQNDVPCPAGSRQEIRRLSPDNAVSSFTPPPAPPAEKVAPPPPLADFVQVVGPAGGPGRPEPPPRADIADADRLPPPPIFQCETWEGNGYISEDSAPAPRCVPLDTGGVGAACETRYDRCARVPDTRACDGWKRRQREIESTWRYARAADRQALQEEFARVTRILQDTTCAQ